MLIELKAAVCMEITHLLVSSFYVSEILDADNLQEKGAFVVHDVKKIQTELFGSILLGWNTMAAGTCGGRRLFTTGLEGERKAGTRDWVSPSRLTPSDPLTSSRPSLRKF